MTKSKPLTHPHIDRAISAAGGIVQFSRDMGVSHQAVYEWKRRGWAPPARARQMQRLYGVPARDTMDPRLLDVLADGSDLI